MSNKSLLIAGIASLTTLACSQAQATLLLHEDFESNTQGSSIIGQAAGGLGLTGNWASNGNGDYNVVAGLEGNNAMQSTAFAGDTIASASHTVAGWGTGQFWQSFLFSEQSYGGHFYVSGGGGYNGAVGHAWWGGGLLGLHNQANPGFSYTPGDTHLMVALIDFDANTTTLWVDPTTNPVNAATPFDAQLGAQVPGASQTLWANAYNTVATIDDIRIGTEFSDVVVPEPSSLALLGLGGLAMVRRRRG